MRRLAHLAATHLDACLAAVSQPGDLTPATPAAANAVWAAIVAMDPTPTHRYLQWICRQVEGGKLKPEDFYKAAPLLKELARCAPLLRAAGVSRDINQYDGLPALSKALRPFQNALTAGETHRDERARIDAETIVHHRCGQLMIVQPVTERASCYWGRGTQWCTAATEAQNAFQMYNQGGDHLSIFILADGSKFQTSSDGTICDAEDTELEWVDLPGPLASALFATEALRELTVKLCGLAISGMPHEQLTRDLCEAAVRQNGMALVSVPISLRNRNICEAAVSRDGAAIEHVPEPLITEQMCEIAVRNDPYALGFIPDELRSDSLCELAIQLNGRALGHVPRELVTERMCQMAVAQSGGALHFVPEEMRTAELCEMAVRKFPTAFMAVPVPMRTDAMVTGVLQVDGRTLAFLPKEDRNQKLCELAVRQTAAAFHFIPIEVLTEKMCELALLDCPSLLGNIPDHLVTDRMRAIACGGLMPPRHEDNWLLSQIFAADMDDELVAARDNHCTSMRSAP